MNNNYILGGGVAGLISAFYKKDYTIITDKIGGWQNLNKFQLGPRLLEVNYNTTSFMRKIGFGNIDIKQINIGYMYENDFITTFADDNFKIKYANKTRELEIGQIHNSILSSGKNKLLVFDIDYDLILKRLEELVSDRIIIKKIFSIDTDNNYIEFLHKELIEKIKYDNLINTLPITLFQRLSKLVDLEEHDFTAFHTTFFKCDYNDYLRKIKNELNLDYFYSIASTHWHRCNLFKHYVVFEVKGKTDILMDNYSVLDKVTIPFAQMKFSYEDINTTKNNIQHIGRFAQWNHKIKMEELIKRFEKNG